MPGTLTITNLSDGTNTGSATDAIRGSARAWVAFSGATGAVSASYNVSSVTRTAVGTYTVALTNVMSDANYAIQMGCGTAAYTTPYALQYGTGAKAAGSFQVYQYGFDPAQVSVAIFR